ncbi:Hypothetical protein NTJ_14596 [Nesidiocoris tenuis]|uniref:Uncharacterized protein n=1 Tax=Nesidiocoris tenuis TaxID=355587 RepID=A0ABN7BDL5_9HEMI|nr:Hypothetical protein NTJ_14596 [Nesidiocoris tenuis]
MATLRAEARFRPNPEHCGSGRVREVSGASSGRCPSRFSLIKSSPIFKPSTERENFKFPSILCKIRSAENVDRFKPTLSDLRSGSPRRRFPRLLIHLR